jgi:D-alanyl-D-alanine carboxypeptidase (penicillin-binding protein 5/6)
MRFFFLFLTLSLFSKQLEVEVSARSAILMNADTGVVLFEKQAHIPAYPASTTKIATALYVLDHQVDLGKNATVSAECLKGRPLKERDHPYWLDSDGTIMGLKRGEVLTIDTLLHGLMLVSGNDAANTIAESLSGSIPKFVEMLNEYLHEIGCKNTQFRNPHGLTHSEHFSTAYDMALMTKKALQLPKFREIVSTLVYLKPKSNKQPEREIRLTNPLMKPKSRYYYQKAIGVKTGYTAAAQDTLVAAAENEERTLIAVLLGCEKSGQRYEDAKRLFETAFNEQKATRRLLGPENIFMKELAGSKAPLRAAVMKGVSIEYFPSEEPKCKAALHWSVDSLPIQKGQKVGEVQIKDESDRLLQKGDLVALEEVKGTFFFVLKEKFSRLFR